MCSQDDVGGDDGPAPSSGISIIGWLNVELPVTLICKERAMTPNLKT